MFEQQAARAPDAVAVVDADRILTYGELNARANQLARYLCARGVGPDVPVGLCLQRSADMVIAMLGILKAGGAYVPLDPSYPAQRLSFMLDDVRAPVLLSNAALVDRLPPFAGHVVAMESLWPGIAQDPDENPPSLNRAQDLAYVVYTSGSTGMPKGVAVPHRGVVRLVHAGNYVDFGPRRRTCCSRRSPLMLPRSSCGERCCTVGAASFSQTGFRRCRPLGVPSASTASPRSG